MWILYIVLGCLAALANRPASDVTHLNRRADVSWLDSFADAGAFAKDLPVGNHLELGQTALVLYVKDLAGNPVDNVQIRLAIGSKSDLHLATRKGKVSLAVFWSQLPVQETFKVRVTAPSEYRAFVVEAVTTASIELDLPQLWSHVPPSLSCAQSNRLPLIFHFAPPWAPKPVKLYRTCAEHDEYLEPTICEQEFTLGVFPVQNELMRNFVDQDGISVETSGMVHCDVCPPSCSICPLAARVFLSWGAVANSRDECLPPGTFHGSSGNSRTLGDWPGSIVPGFLSMILGPGPDLLPMSSEYGEHRPVREPCGDFENTMDPILRCFPIPSDAGSAPSRHDNLSLGFVF